MAAPMLAHVKYARRAAIHAMHCLSERLRLRLRRPHHCSLSAVQADQRELLTTHQGVVRERDAALERIRDLQVLRRRSPAPAAPGGQAPHGAALPLAQGAPAPLSCRFAFALECAACGQAAAEPRCRASAADERALRQLSAVQAELERANQVPRDSPWGGT